MRSFFGWCLRMGFKLLVEVIIHAGIIDLT